jgi:multiple sugar transport system substrate-binding protein
MEANMKRSLFFLLVIALTAAVASAQAPTLPELKGKNVEINFWTHEDANRMVIEKRYIAEFMAANPGLTVNYVTYPSSKIWEALTTAFAANQGPTIFNIVITSAVSFMDNGRVAPVDYKALGLKNAAALKAEYLPGMLDPVIRDGDIYGLPLEITNMCLYLNKKMYRDAGIDPDKNWPRTWEEVMAHSEKIVKRDGQIITRRGFDFRYDGYLTTFMPMVEQLGGALVSDDGKEVIVNDAAWLRVLQYLKDFGPGGKNLGSPTYTAARTQFDQNKDLVALSFSGLYQEARMKTANPAFYNSSDWMVIPFPQWKDAKKTVTANYSGHYYMVNVQSPEIGQYAAWVLLRYMLSHGDEYLDKVAIVQPSKALVDSPLYKGMPYSDVFTKDYEVSKIVYMGKLSARINTLLKEAFEGVMVGGVEPQAALDKLKKGARQAYDEAD